MRKPYQSEVYMYRNLLWLAVGVFLFLPFLCSFVLSLVSLLTAGDIAYGKLSDVLAVVRDGLGIFAGYTGLGVLTVSVIYFGRNARGVIAMAFLSHIVTYFSGILTYAIYGGDYLGFSIVMLTSDALVNLIVYLGLYLILLLIVKKKETVLNVPSPEGRYFDKSHPLAFAVMNVAVIYGAVSLIVLVVTMTVDFLDPSLGPPVSRADKIYWVLEYAAVIAEALVGYALMLLCVKLSQIYLKQYRKKAEKAKITE